MIGRNFKFSTVISFNDVKLDEKLDQKLEFHTNGKAKFSIIWSTRKIESLFKIKDSVKHLCCVIYQRICSCGNNYISEIIRNAVTRTDNKNN